MTPTSTIRLRHRAAVDTEAWVIGDVHGMADLLDKALGIIEATPPIAVERILSQTGDLIDRGPESLRAIDLMIAAPERLDCEVNGLIGNHEQMLLLAAFTRKERWHKDGFYPLWVDNGGWTTVDELRRLHGLDSYIHPSHLPYFMSIERWDYLRTLSPSWRKGDLVFVHAGIDPGRGLSPSLADQWDNTRENSRLWIRSPFLRAQQQDKGRVTVVHGHTPHDGTQDVDAANRGRLNMDRGSWDTGVVRLARIVDDEATIWDVTT